MKTKIYLRLSLLIPILIWGFSLLAMAIVSASPMKELISMESLTLPNLIFLSITFYALGIIIWILPYLLLSLILLILSFRVKAQAMIKVFALSPIAMTLLTVLFMNLLMLGTSTDGLILSNPLIKDPDTISFIVIVLVFSLLWGYICVGIGFGIYRLLQYSQVIRDEENLEPAARLISQYE